MLLIVYRKLLLIASALLLTVNGYCQMEESERYTRGWNKLQEIDGAAGEKVVNSLSGISPELGRYIIEYAFGDVYSLTALDNKQKEIVAVSSLVAQGAIPQLKVHFNGALNVGCSVTEVKELILQMSVYTGFPRCINAMNALKDVLAERKSEGIMDRDGEMPIDKIDDGGDRYSKGASALSLLDSLQIGRLEGAYRDFAPELARFVVEYGYGDIFSRQGLSPLYRQLATIAALATMGNAASQLKFHIGGALNIGVTEAQIKETMLLVGVYAGFPAAINGTNVLRETVNERHDTSPQ